MREFIFKDITHVHKQREGLGENNEILNTRYSNRFLSIGRSLAKLFLVYSIQMENKMAEESH